MRPPIIRALAITVAILVVGSPAEAGLARGDTAPPRIGNTPVRVSGPSPYAACDVPTFHGEATFVNGEVEPRVAVDPSNPRHFVGAWQQDRHSLGGGANGLMSAFSLDQGKTWHRTTLPFDACAPGGLNFERTSDPWVSIGPDGTVYAISISWNSFRNGRNVVAATTSADGGASWDAPVIVHAGPAKNGLGDDKESITADPVRAGVAYATWELFELVPARHRDDEHLIVRRAASGGVRSRQISAPLWFAKTVDGGATWESHAIYLPGPGASTLSGQIIVDPRRGTLYDFFNLLKGRHRYQEVMRSDDGGVTWSDPVRIGRDFGFGVRHPNTGKPLRVGNEVPDAAIDPRNGDLYAVWEDSRFSGFRYDEVALSVSTDGGETWSDPRRVNTPTGLPAFTPSVEVTPNGFVGVSYYDLRDVGAATRTLPTDAWLVKLRDGRRIGEWKLAGPFDMMTAPNAGGFFLGDYEGLATSGNRFVAFFAVANDGRSRNPTDIVSIVR